MFDLPNPNKIFSDAEVGLFYMTECTLATVETLLSKKSTPKGELSRQMMMAAIGVATIKESIVMNQSKCNLMAMYGCSRVLDQLGMNID